MRHATHGAPQHVRVPRSSTPIARRTRNTGTVKRALLATACVIITIALIVVSARRWTPSPMTALPSTRPAPAVPLETVLHEEPQHHPDPSAPNTLNLEPTLQPAVMQALADEAHSVEEYASDALLVTARDEGHSSRGIKKAWHHENLGILVDKMVQRRAALIRWNRSQPELFGHIESQRRYRQGGLAVVLGTATKLHEQQLLNRMQYCHAIHEKSVERASSSRDMLFESYSARRELERHHQCFGKGSMFLLSSLPSHASLMQQVEHIMTLVFMGSLTSRTVVLPLLRLPSGDRVSFSSLFDARFLYAATASQHNGQAPVTCILDADEFLTLEISRVAHLRGETKNENDAVSGWHQLGGVGCVAVHDQEDIISGLTCGEMTLAPFPTHLTTPNSDALMEEAVSRILEVLTGSFHRILHFGPLVVQALAAALPALVKSEGRLAVSSLQAASASYRTIADAAPAELLRCLWSLLQPHPFSRRVSHLLDVVLEEKFPSRAGRNRTIDDRSRVAHMIPRVERRPFGVCSSRVGDRVVHVNPLIGWGIPCAAVEQRQHTLRCSIQTSTLDAITQRTSDDDDGAVLVLHGRDAEAEAARVAAMIKHHSESMAVTTIGAQINRHNRLTSFIKIVVDRRKLYVGSGNLILLDGFSPSESTRRPFRLMNVFVLEGSLLEELLVFWTAVTAKRYVSAAPWTALHRAAALRRWANEGLCENVIPS